MRPDPILAGILSANVVLWSLLAGLTPSPWLPLWVELPLHLILGVVASVVIWTNRERGEA